MAVQGTPLIQSWTRMLKYREEISSLATIRILAVSRFPIELDLARIYKITLPVRF